MNTELFREQLITSTNAYPISWFRELFSLLAAMFCRLYGSANCTLFKAKWVTVAHHILLTGDSFNWAHVLSLNLRDEIEKNQKTSTNQKPTFYMSGFVMDGFYATSPFLDLNWNQNKNCAPVHI